MKKIILLILVLLTNKAFGQDCEEKLVVNETNPMTKNKELKSPFLSYKVNFKHNHTISFELRNRKILLISTSTSKEVNRKGTELGFTFENNENLSIRFSEMSNLKQVDGKSLIYFNSTEINLQELELFASQQIIKVNLRGNGEVISLKKKRAALIKEYVNCFYLNIERDKDLGEAEEVVSNIPSYYRPCNIVEDEIDEFEGYHKKALHYAGIAKPAQQGFPLFVNLFGINEELFMTAELDAFSYCITNSSRINIKLEDNTIVRLSNLSGTHCGKRAKYEIKFSEDDKEALGKSPIKLIRLETEDGNIDLPFILIKNYFVENIYCI